jgi:hypothetical protein
VTATEEPAMEASVLAAMEAASSWAVMVGIGIPTPAMVNGREYYEKG